MIDWDLEAPGVERFFDVDGEAVRNSPGLLDLLLRYKERLTTNEMERPIFEDIHAYVVDIDNKTSERGGGRLAILPAGRRADEHFTNYAATVRTFDWTDFYERWGGELFFADLKRQCQEIADVVLIDSRTGVTEMGGVCTYQLADVVVMLCAPSQQCLDGTFRLATDYVRPEVNEVRGTPLKLLIVPARLENAETEQLNSFKSRFLELFAHFEWRQVGQGGGTSWELGIPYVPYYAFNERLAVVETPAGSEHMVTAFERLAERLNEFLHEQRRLLKQLRVPTLRFTPTRVAQNRWEVEIVFESIDSHRKSVVSNFSFNVSAQEQEDLRWYLEEYPQYAADLAPKIAARVEKRIAEMGEDLFTALFQTDDDTRDLWATLRDRLSDTRIEIVSQVSEAASVPWELIRDPKTGMPLSLSAKAFVRTAHRSAVTLPLLENENGAGPVRILLVMFRPGGDDDIPFRSVARRLIKALRGEAHEALQLDVLRPPTFSRLSAVLREAQAEGKPYHVVHFDGHGAFFEAGDRQASLFLSPPRDGAHGYLVFENPVLANNQQYVDGPALGRLLWEAGVPVLVLNACRSAHAEPRAQPDSASAPNVHAEARAFGSLAQEVVDLGLAGVVAMRYNVYVVTAAQFVADLYESLANGETLGEAVTLGRKQLQAQPLRELAYDSLRLQDWMVPVVYEAAPIALFPRPERKTEFNIKVSGAAAAPSVGGLAREVEETPDSGFIGRDETLLALDRAFDTQAIVLLHAYAGSGKTSTAAEFARWYQLTGGIDGPVLFTSFERYKPLAQVLHESIGRVFESALERIGIHWLTLTDEQRRGVTLDVMSQVPMLWIWDNVEPIHGFPAGTPSAWSEDEQDALVDFLRAARWTKAKLVLTSRREEWEWLGDLPRRIAVPPMPMQECVQLARAVAEKHRRPLASVGDWIPLLRFTRGNPMTLTVLVGQALRDGLRTREQIETFAERLRSGETAFDDEASEGRDQSLGASLAYAFEHAFSNAERAQLALLHLFQGFVDVDVLCWMGNRDVPWCLPKVRGLTRDSGISLLDRTAGVGLLTSHGSGHSSIHPALPWFFRSLFEAHYTSIPADDDTPRLKATRAFVESIGELGSFYFRQFESSSRGVIAALAVEEANLLHAWRLAREHAWHKAVIGAMQGLRILYGQTGRRAEWARLVVEVVPDFVDTADGPLAGREDDWSLVTEYRFQLARDSRNWPEAERLQRMRIDWNRQRALSALAMPVEALDGTQRQIVRTLAASLHELGETQRELEEQECVASYEEALRLSESIADHASAATCAFNLGNTFKDLPTLRDLDRAEQWYRRSLELRDERDSQGRAQCLAQLGYVVYERFKEAHSLEQPEAEVRRHLNAALDHYFQALDLLPPNAVDDLRVAHGQIGNIYGDAGDTANARSHWREAIRYAENGDDSFDAGRVRVNVAVSFAEEGRFSDAREYALAALRNFEPFGAGASEQIQKTQRLLSDIEQRLQSQAGR
jgi:tetratricopeptide (TPR) repeat protein